MAVQKQDVKEQLLNAVFRRFRQNSDWPLAAIVERELEDTLDAAGGFEAVAASIGTHLLTHGQLGDSGATVRLSLRALAERDGGKIEIDAFLSLANFAARKIRASDSSNPQLRRTEFEVGTGIDTMLARRAFRLALDRPDFTNGGNSDQMSLTRFAQKLDGVSSLEDYEPRLESFRQRTQRSPVPDNRPVAEPIRRIFLSHAAADARIAEYLARVIEDAVGQATVFVASTPGHIDTGESWLERIYSELRDADAFLVILTPNSVDRGWILFETGAAWMSGRRLILLAGGSLPKSSIPMPLAAHQALSIDNDSDLDQLCKDLGVAVADAAKFRKDLRLLWPAARADGLVTKSQVHGA